MPDDPARDATAAPRWLFPGGLSDDCLLNGAVRLWQPVGGYRVAVDPVLLAAATPAGSGDTVGDFGAGSGAVGLCLAARTPRCRVIAIEREPDMAVLAAANARRNGMAARLSLLQADVSALPFAAGCFDHVAMNPPYLAAAEARAPVERLRRVASVEDGAGPAIWLANAWSLTRPGGTVCLIHRADRLEEIAAACHRLQDGGLTIVPIWPRAGQPAHRIIVRLRRGDRSRTLLTAGLTLHRSDGCFTPEAEAILRNAEALAV